VSAAQRLIEIVEANGGRFMVDGDRLGIVPATAAALVMEELRRHKAELIAEIARRPAMPRGVRLMRWEPRDAPVRLSECETVTNVDLFIRSTLRQVEARLQGRHWLAGNWTLSTLLDRLVVVGCIVELENPGQAWQ